MDCSCCEGWRCHLPLREVQEVKKKNVFLVVNLYYFRYGIDDDLSSYSGFKFEQLITSDKPGVSRWNEHNIYESLFEGEAVIYVPVDNRICYLSECS